jgi:AAA family ATP:ADP antiporter
MNVIPAEHHENDCGVKSDTAEKTGAMEGLRLIFTKTYLVGLLLVSTIYDIVGAIIDLQFLTLANRSFPISEELTAFLGFFAMSLGLVSTALSLFGTSYFLQKIGVKKGLMVYPMLTAITLVLLWFFPKLASFFLAMILFKVVSYTLNSPVKELLYLPTSNDVKMKSKGFIDGFASRMSKAIGSLITDRLQFDVNVLLNYGCLISLGVVGFWIVVAKLVGDQYSKLMEENQIIK